MAKRWRALHRRKQRADTRHLIQQAYQRALEWFDDDEDDYCRDYEYEYDDDDYYSDDDFDDYEEDEPETWGY